MVKRLEVGILKTNCYLLEINNKIIIIDPGSDYKFIKSSIKKEVNFILITHNHFDHVGALSKLKDHYNVKSYDISNLKEGKNVINDVKFKMIYTKGHTNDSVSYLFNDIMFTGDFLFKNTIGRFDFKNSSKTEMRKSIEKILEYDGDIKIYPGHGPSTYLKDEKNKLKYFKENI